MTGPNEDCLGWGVLSSQEFASKLATDLVGLPIEASLVGVSSRSRCDVGVAGPEQAQS